MSSAEVSCQLRNCSLREVAELTAAVYGVCEYAHSRAVDGRFKYRSARAARAQPLRWLHLAYNARLQRLKLAIEQAERHTLAS